MKELRISTNVEEFDIPLIHRFLSASYWAKGISIGVVHKAIANSLCFGGFLGTSQVAFGRAVTDLTRFAYLLDFFVLQGHRGKGYGKSIIEAAMSRLKKEGVQGVMLCTADAHGLYEKFGFKRVGGSPKLMACALGSEERRRAKAKRLPKPRLFSGICPKCGSSEVRLDLGAAENLKRVPLTAVTSSILPGMGTKVRLRCEKCRARFLG